VALTVAGVPDGRPTQPLASPPYCVGRAGTAGTILLAQRGRFGFADPRGFPHCSST
jgi:hypothetical protein